MKIRTILLIYLAAFLAGAIYKYLLYLIQPDSFVHINSTVVELSVVSAIVTVAVSFFYMIKQKKLRESGD